MRLEEIISEEDNKVSIGRYSEGIQRKNGLGDNSTDLCMCMPKSFGECYLIHESSARKNADGETQK